MFVVVVLQWIARIKNRLKLRPTRYRTYSNQIISIRLIRSDNESAEEGDFEVVYGKTCMTMSERSVRDHDWRVWICKAGVIRLIFSVANKLYSQTSSIRTPQGQNQLSGLQRCPYYRGRKCIIFGICGTKRTVRSSEVSVL